MLSSDGKMAPLLATSRLPALSDLGHSDLPKWLDSASGTFCNTENCSFNMNVYSLATCLGAKYIVESCFLSPRDHIVDGGGKTYLHESKEKD